MQPAPSPADQPPADQPSAPQQPAYPPPTDQSPAYPAPMPRQPAPPPAGLPERPTRAWVGLLLVAPAGLALLIGYVWPTVRTIWNSFYAHTLVGDREWVGFDNYQRLGDSPPLGLGLTMGVAIGLLAILVVVAPVLAWAAFRAGRGMRFATRLALTLPMVCLAPTALAIAWADDRESRLLLADFPDRLADPTQGPSSVIMILWLSVFGLVCGLGVTFYLAVFRGRRPGGSAWPAGLAVGGLAVITAVAVALQTFTYPMVLTRGGPSFATTTPMLTAYQVGLSQLDFGYGAAISTILLIPLLLLGLAAGLVVALTGLRVEVEAGSRAATEPAGWPTTRVLALVVGIIGLLLVVGIAAYGLWPWLSRLGDFGPDVDPSVLANTWLPPLISAVIGVGLAALAGYGIGALRPLGRHSEFLLLPFAPWLFIGVGPLFATKFESAMEGERLNSFLGFVPPIWLVVPALFLFTLVFRGLVGQRRSLAAQRGTDPGPAWVLVRSLPMVALVGLATWVVQAQGLLWGLTVGVGDFTAPVWLLLQRNQFGAGSEVAGLGLVLPIPVIVLLALGLGLLQLLYLDRLAIRVGPDRPPALSSPAASGPQPPPSPGPFLPAPGPPPPPPPPPGPPPPPPPPSPPGPPPPPPGPPPPGPPPPA